MDMDGAFRWGILVVDRDGETDGMDGWTGEPTCKVVGKHISRAAKFQKGEMGNVVMTHLPCAHAYPHRQEVISL